MRKIGTVYSEKIGLAVRGLQMGLTHTLLLYHTYTQARDAHTPLLTLPQTLSPPLHFIYSERFLWGVHLSELFSSHLCHISLSLPGCLFATPPLDSHAGSAWNKRDKY